MGLLLNATYRRGGVGKYCETDEGNVGFRLFMRFVDNKQMCW